MRTRFYGRRARPVPVRSGHGYSDRSGAGRLDDLGHHLAQVAVGLEDHELTRRAVAALEQVLDRLELGRRAEVAGVVGQPVEHPAHERLRGHALAGREVDELAVEAV